MLTVDMVAARTSTDKLGGVRGVELFQVGIRGGIPFHEKDLDDAIRNFQILSKGPKKIIDAALKTGHDKIDKEGNVTTVPRIGSGTDLWKEKRVCEECGGTGNWRNGDEFYSCPYCDNDYGYPTGRRTILKGSFGEVPRVVAEAVANKAYKHISAEFYPEGHSSLAGLPHKGIVFRGAGILGADLPKVKTLNDLSKAEWIYAEMECEPTLLRFSESVTEGGVIIVFSEVLGYSDINIMTGKSSPKMLSMDDIGGGSGSPLTPTSGSGPSMPPSGFAEPKMPAGTRVEKCIQDLKGKPGINRYAVCQASTHQNLHTGKTLSHADLIAHLHKHGLHATEHDGLIHVHHAPDHIHSVLTRGGHETIQDNEGCTYSDMSTGHKFYLRHAEGSTAESGTTKGGGDVPAPTRSPPSSSKVVGGYEGGTLHPLRPEHQAVLSRPSVVRTGNPSSLKTSTIPWGGTGSAAYAEKPALGNGKRFDKLESALRKHYQHSEGDTMSRAELETILTAAPHNYKPEFLKKFDDAELVQFSEGLVKAQKPVVLTFSEQSMADAYHHLHNMGLPCEPATMHHEGMKHGKQTLKLHHGTHDAHRIFAENGYKHHGHGKFIHNSTGHEYHTDHDEMGNVHVHKFSESASGGDNDMTPAQVNALLDAKLGTVVPELTAQLNKAIATFSEGLQPIRDDVAGFKTSTHREGIMAFCEGEARERLHAWEMDESATDAKGKRIPTVVDRMMKMSTDKVYEFSEGGKSVMKSELDLYKDEIMKRPRWSGEKSRQGVPGRGTTANAQSQTMQEIIQFAETNENILRDAGYEKKEDFIKVFENAREEDRQQILQAFKKGAA